MSGAWKAAVVQRLAGTATALDDGWALADAAGPRHPSASIDARTPRAVTFDLDATACRSTAFRDSHHVAPALIVVEAV